MHFLSTILLTASVLITALSYSSAKAPAYAGAKTFVLVHGAWVGEWYWDPVVEKLTARGHKAYAVSLKGHGKRAWENSPQVSLQDHINDVAGLIAEQKLNDVYLIGHSYGTRPATGAWDKVRTKIKHMVYIDGIVPDENTTKAIPRDQASLDFLKRRMPRVIDMGVMPVNPRLPVDMLARATPQSLKALFAPIHLQHGPLPMQTKRTFIVAKNNPLANFHKIAERLRLDGRWQVIELNSGHNVVKDAAGELADLLSGLK